MVLLSLALVLTLATLLNSAMARFVARKLESATGPSSLDELIQRNSKCHEVVRLTLFDLIVVSFVATAISPMHAIVGLLCFFVLFFFGWKAAEKATSQALLSWRMIVPEVATWIVVAGVAIIPAIQKAMADRWV